MFTTYLSKKKIHQEDVIILNIYAPNTRAPKLTEETLLQLKSHTDPHTVIMADCSTPLLPTEGLSRQKTKPRDAGAN